MPPFARILDAALPSWFTALPSGFHRNSFTLHLPLLRHRHTTMSSHSASHCHPSVLKMQSLAPVPGHPTSVTIWTLVVWFTFVRMQSGNLSNHPTLVRTRFSTAQSSISDLISMGKPLKYPSTASNQPTPCPHTLLLLL